MVAGGIGERIAEARRAAGLTQVELSKRLGVAALTVSHWECGRKGISLKNLQAISRHVHRPIGALLGLEDDGGDDGQAA